MKSCLACSIAVSGVQVLICVVLHNKSKIVILICFSVEFSSRTVLILQHLHSGQQRSKSTQSGLLVAMVRVYLQHTPGTPGSSEYMLDGTIIHHRAPCPQIHCMFWGGGRKLENLEKPTWTWGKFCTAKNTSTGLNWGPWRCEEAALCNTSPY